MKEATKVYCRSNDVGRVSWVENLTLPYPSGDCSGPMMRVVNPTDFNAKAMSLKTSQPVETYMCERHFLQIPRPMLGAVVSSSGVESE